MKGHSTADADTKKIILEDGGGTEEKTIVIHSGDHQLFTIEKPSGNTTVEIPSDGYYILNGRNDTIIGSYQQYGAPQTAYTTVSQEILKRDIDSLQQLISQKNINAANHTYFILPYQAVKITDNLEAFMVTPFHRMTSIEKSGDKDPEVYRFWSIKEIRETISKLTTLTQSKN